MPFAKKKVSKTIRIFDLRNSPAADYRWKINVKLYGLRLLGQTGMLGITNVEENLQDSKGPIQ